MSNTKYTAKERQKFKMRLAAIELLIPENYSEVIYEKTEISKHIIRNVRQGRTFNMQILKELEALSKKELVTK